MTAQPTRTRWPMLTGMSGRVRGRPILVGGLTPLVAGSLILSFGAGPATSADQGIPPEVDPGTPTYSGEDDPVPDEPAEFDPATNMLQAIFDADAVAGGDSYWIDRILERPAGGSGGDELYTRGRALYMYNHDEDDLGFGGGWAYRERPSGGNQNLYTIEVSGADFDEDEDARAQYPSHWTSVHTDDGLTAEQAKFITHNNVAVTLLTLTNTGNEPTSRTVTAGSPPTSETDGSERTGKVVTRYDVTTVTPRFSGDGFDIVDGDLVRDVSLEPGESITLKLQFGATTAELPDSDTEYERYRDYTAQEALATHLAEYNKWWADNVPYIDLPDENVKKMSYYRTFLNRFNLVDANIPGNDYQFPVSVEGALGYNNAIQLTQGMHLQDLKYFRDPIYAYGNVLSSGETSRCAAFTDNPGSHSWGNTYEQYIGREGWNAFKVHGGDDAFVRNFAHYTECDVEGQIDKYDTNGNNLIEYPHGFLTGNDFDATPFFWASPFPGSPANRQDRAESAFWYSGARAAAEAYEVLGQNDKAAEMNALADDMRDEILTLWDPAPVDPAEGERPGHVFKHRLVSNDELIPWKDQQNFVPFIERVAPTDDPQYREALRYYADADEFPIMPFYTANQADKAEAAAMGRGGSNNFSNINSTLQAQVFSAAIRDYPSEYVTEGMYRSLLEWLTWVQYANGDNRLPNNNEFFFNWNPNTQTFGRSGIDHNILGAYNFMIIDDIAGVRPRLDDVLELWPIDVGYDYFAVNNLNYHGKDLTVVWDRVDHYGSEVPDGFSVYLDRQRLFTLDELAHVTFDGETAEVTVLDDSGAEVTYSVTIEPPTDRNDCRGDAWRDYYNPSFRAMGVCVAWVESGGGVQGVIGPLQAADEITLRRNDRMVDMLQKAGRDITPETGNAENLAEGRPVTASFTTTSPASRATEAEFAVDGYTISGLPATAGGNNFSRPGYVSPNTIWGTEGSPNDEDWLEVDLGSAQEIDNIKVYFYSDKDYDPQQNSDGDTYREPALYLLQYHDGSDWVNIWGHRSSAQPLPNLNEVAFPRVTTDRVRLLVIPQDDYGVGVKEIQVFNTGIDVEPLTAPQVFALASPTSGIEPLTVQFTGFAEDPQGGDVTIEWDFGDGSTSSELSPEHTYAEPGSYTATLTATDEDGETGSASVAIEVEEFDGNWAPFATATCSYTSPWENCQGINSGIDPTSSSPGIGVGWGTWPEGGEQWMQLDWTEPITTDRTEVYWYDDNGGVQVPGSWVLEYWDDGVGDWVEVPNPSGYETEQDQYNVTTHDPVTTTAMRVTVQTAEGVTAVGALQWKVFEPGS
ncbi:MAG TPA: PKD domain-containing protein [Jiangellaceae bacterium]